jgi:hypothetical protein
MKKTIFIKTILAGCLFLVLNSSDIFAQTTVRIFYLAPTDTIRAHYTGALATYIFADSCNRAPTGYSGVLLDNQTAGIFRRIAPPRIKGTYDSLTNTTSTLRREIRKVNTLSNGRIQRSEIFLFDDRNGLIASDNCKCDHLYGAIRGIWPCAGNWRNRSGNYTGDLYLGELAANYIITNFPGGYWAWDETVIHEFSHTQFAREYINDSTAVVNKWGPNGVSISYGGDDGHWGQELLADQQLPLDEGLASFWSLDRNAASRDSLVSFMNSKDSRFYLGSHSFLTGTAAMWNSPHRVIATVTIPPQDANGQRIVNITFPNGRTGRVRLVAPHIQTGAGYELRSFKWLDVPGDYVFYNEQMAQGLALMFHEFAFSSRTRAYNAIFDAARAITPPNQRLKYPGFFANNLANSMEAYARTSAGRSEETAGTLTSSMFVYALYDLFTHFGMTEEKMRRELLVNFDPYKPIPKPLAFDNYFSQRDAVKQVACQYLEGNNCQHGTGAIDIRRAVEAIRNYYRDPSRILR